MKLGRREALRRQEKEYNGKWMQFKKNTVEVTADGEVFCENDHLRELVEHQLYYSPVQDRWMARSVHGATIVYR